MGWGNGSGREGSLDPALQSPVMQCYSRELLYLALCLSTITGNPTLDQTTSFTTGNMSTTGTTGRGTTGTPHPNNSTAPPKPNNNGSMTLGQVLPNNQSTNSVQPALIPWAEFYQTQGQPSDNLSLHNQSVTLGFEMKSYQLMVLVLCLLIVSAFIMCALTWRCR